MYMECSQGASKFPAPRAPQLLDVCLFLSGGRLCSSAGLLPVSLLKASLGSFIDKLTCVFCSHFLALDSGFQQYIIKVIAYKHQALTLEKRGILLEQHWRVCRTREEMSNATSGGAGT